MGFTKAQLEAKYGVPCYVRWNLVPIHLHARTWFYGGFGVRIPDDAKPDAVKGGGMAFNNFYSYLFDEKKYLPAETVAELDKERAEAKKKTAPRLKRNFEK